MIRGNIKVRKPRTILNTFSALRSKKRAFTNFQRHKAKKSPPAHTWR